MYTQDMLPLVIDWSSTRHKVSHRRKGSDSGPKYVRMDIFQFGADKPSAKRQPRPVRIAGLLTAGK